jgi:hypothetical protein
MKWYNIIRCYIPFVDMLYGGGTDVKWIFTYFILAS